MGVSVTGGQCVKVAAKEAKESALYIVGGTVNDTASTWDYSGLQRFSFSQKRWEWVRPLDLVTQNRRNHAAAFINSTQSILVYSGSQDPGYNGPSSSTFAIKLEPPFEVKSYSSTAPPAVKPMLLPWDDKSAVMFGGGDSNEAVFTWSPDGGWKNLGVTLSSPITNQDAVQCTIVSGDDGSKVLEKFDMSGNGDKVSRIVLLTAGGVVAAPGTTVGNAAKQRRELTIDDWPEYNGTYAPNSTRSGYSITQDDKGVAVLSGGNEDDPLCMFDQKRNAWLNATEVFNGQQLAILSTPTSTSPSSASATAPLAASSTAASVPAMSPVNNKTRMMTVLGATLGAIFGIAIILILILLCLRYKKGKKRKEAQSGYIEKDRLSFADRGAAFMSEAGGSVGHKYSNSMNASQSSLAIISGRGNSNHKRGLGPLGSDASTQGLVTKKSPLGYSDPVEMSKLDMKVPPSIAELDFEKEGDFEKEMDFEKSAPPQPPPAPAPAARPVANIGRSRSSGWSRYFANNEATNLAHMPSGRSTYASERTSTGSQSLYTDSRMYSQPSQTVPPLEIHSHKFDGQRLSHVTKGSPTLGNSSENLRAHQPMQAELARANSHGSSKSGVSQVDDHYIRDPVESWTPMGGTGYSHRPTSSNYTNSVVVTDQANPYFYPGRLGGGPEERDSTVTVFPRGVPEDSEPRRQNPGQPDMSWLNLGTGNH